MRTRVQRHPTSPTSNSNRRPHRGPRRRLIFAGGVLAGALVGASVPDPAEAATITASYAVGHREVRINGYGAPGLGTFTLRADPDDPRHDGERLALCLEANSSHTARPDAYRRVANRVDSPQLDYLLWKYGVPGSAAHTELGDDHDTATALAALAWFYADAQRRAGGPVWANPADGLAPLSPAGPRAWDTLPAYTSGFPVGLRASGFDLDGAERRVHELYREAEARRGPWTMSPIEHGAGRAAVTVHGPAGPIPRAGGVRFVVRDHHGRVVANRVVTTDATGRAEIPVDRLGSRGGSITASMYAPGVHEEWDGDGDVQRMSTGTSARLGRRLAVGPEPRFVEVVKRSSDDAFSPVGGRFALLDGDGGTVSTATTGSDGRAQFGPVDPVRHPGPYRIREVTAPDGLEPLARDVPVPTPLSTDRADPTTVEVDNDPEHRHLRIRKVLDDDRLGPADRSGFGFDVVRDDGRSFGTATTDADGRTPPIAVTLGRFEVCERGRPPWAEVLADGGCVTVPLDADAPATTEIAYTNLAPAPAISTRVETAGTDHALLAPDGGTLVDVVTHTGLVPGTAYELHGEVLAVTSDGTSDGPVSTGLTGRARFVPDRSDGEVAVPIEVPADAAIDVGVVVQRLYLADAPGAEPVAVHVDPAAASQTFWVPTIATAARLEPTGLVDQVAYRGLPPGSYTASVVWHERLADGDCRATDLGATASFRIDDDGHHGTIDVGPVPAGDEHAGRTLVAFQTITVESDVDIVPDEIVPDEIVPDEIVMADHHDCGADEQTVALDPAAPDPTTTTPATTTTTPATPTTTTPPSTTTTPATTTTTSTVVEQASPPPPEIATTVALTSSTTGAPLPAAGSGGVRGHTGVALMALGAGGLIVVTAAQGRRAVR